MGKVIKCACIILAIIWVLFVVFAKTNYFVEKELLLKIYSYLIFIYLGGGILIMKGSVFIRVDKFTSIFFLLYIYILTNTLFTVSNNLNSFCLIGFIIYYFLFKSLLKYTPLINIILLGVCLLQCLYGILQYYNFIDNYSLFPITGSYDNPAGYAACISIAYPLLFTFISTNHKLCIKTFLAMFIVVIGVLLSESRSGVFSIIIVTFVYLWSVYVKRHKLLSILIIIVISFVFILLLYFKTDSTLGRIFIWKVCWYGIKESLLFGNGCGSFIANYMEYQGDYLAKYPNHRCSLLADNIVHPFNEYILFVLEYGFLGLILLLIFIIFILRNNKLSSPYILCLISIFTFGLFSYPLKYPFIWLIIAYCLAQISHNKKYHLFYQFEISNISKLLISLFCLISIFFIYKNIEFEYTWKRIETYYMLGYKQEMLPEYNNLYRSWNGDYLFLYNYGAVLSYSKNYKKIY